LCIGNLSVASSGRLHDMQRLRVAPRCQQRRFTRLGFVQVRFLDVAVAADVLGDAGDVHRQCQPARIQAVDQFLQGLLVVTDQLTLAATFLGVTEHVEAAAAQALELGQQAEGLEHPRAVFFLLQLALFVGLANSGGARWKRTW